MSSQQQICPLCQKQNHCAITLGKPITECWCHKQTFPSKNQQFSSHKGSAANVSLDVDACICEACLKKLIEQADKRLD